MNNLTTVNVYHEKLKLEQEKVRQIKEKKENIKKKEEELNYNKILTGYGTVWKKPVEVSSQNDFKESIGKRERLRY